jgi:hypothetical protein
VNPGDRFRIGITTLVPSADHQRTWTLDEGEVQVDISIEERQ